MKKSFLLFFSLFLFASCSARIKDSVQDKKERFMRNSALKVQEEINKENKEKLLALENYVKSVPLKEKVCQLFIENLEGDTVFVPIEKDFIPGGYIFFSYNLKDSPKEIIKFTNSIKNYCAKKNIIPPYLAVDQEGGFVNRLKIVNGPLPSAERVAEKTNVATSYKLYETQAKQMRSLGFDVNLAPVVEVKTLQNEKFLEGRSFGSLEKVKAYGTSFINAFENNGIGSVIKHFPGNSNTDPHSGLPEIDVSLEQIPEFLESFKSVLRAEPAGTLMSHARVKSIDGEIPACFSKKWVSEILQKDFGFSGIIFSDDIFMGALSKNGFPPEEAAVKAIEAGINVIMVSEKRISSPANVLIKKAEEDENFKILIEKSFRKVLDFKLSHNIISIEKNENSEKDKNGLYKINFLEQDDSEPSIKNRVNNFNKARNENIEIYIENFD